MYIYSNNLEDETGLVGTFSSHSAAFEAFMKLHNDAWCPLGKSKMTDEDLRILAEINIKKTVDKA